MPVQNPGFEAPYDAGGSILKELADKWEQNYHLGTGAWVMLAFGGFPYLPFEDFESGHDTNEAFEYTWADTTSTGAFVTNEDFELGWDNSMARFEFGSGSNAIFDLETFITATNPTPVALSDGDTLSLTANGSPVTSDPFEGSRATVLGSGGSFPTGFSGTGNLIRVTIDDGVPIVIDFAGANDIPTVIGTINVFTATSLTYEVGGQIEFRSPTEGYASRLVLEEIVPAKVQASNVAPFALTDGMTLQLAIDGGGTQTITFSAGDFPDISNATGFDVKKVINEQLTGATAEALFGFLKITSDTLAGSSVEVVGGTALAVLGFTAGVNLAPLATIGHTPVDVTGSGTVRDLAAVTAEEIETVVNGTLAVQTANAELRAISDDEIRLYTTEPETGTIQVDASPVATALGFPVGAPEGPSGVTADTDEDFESGWGNFVSTLPATASAGFGTEDFETWAPSFAIAFPSSLGAAFDGESSEDFEEVAADVTFSVDPALDEITTTADHGLSTGDFVTLYASVRLPSPLSEGVPYYAEVVDATTIQLRLNAGGAILDLADVGSGTLTLKHDRSVFWTETL